jgi:hypothetical protein
MKDNNFIKIILIVIFTAMVVVFLISTVGLFFTPTGSNKSYFINLSWIISFGFIGVFLFLKLIHDRIR